MHPCCPACLSPPPTALVATGAIVLLRSRAVTNVLSCTSLLACGLLQGRNAVCRGEVHLTDTQTHTDTHRYTRARARTHTRAHDHPRTPSLALVASQIAGSRPGWDGATHRVVYEGGAGDDNRGASLARRVEAWRCEGGQIEHLHVFSDKSEPSGSCKASHAKKESRPPGKAS